MIHRLLNSFPCVAFAGPFLRTAARISSQPRMCHANDEDVDVGTSDLFVRNLRGGPGMHRRNLSDRYFLTDRAGEHDEQQQYVVRSGRVGRREQRVEHGGDQQRELEQREHR